MHGRSTTAFTYDLNEPQSRSELYEDAHVHQVYEQIASHFSSTRYKPWPIVERFLKELPDGSIGLDVGCGNGKYLTVNPKIFIVASDRSTNLVNIASQHRPHTSIVADNLNLPHPNSTFDFAISIAVIHHLSTPGRRIQAVTAILDSLRPSTKSESSGYQQDGGKRSYTSGHSSRSTAAEAGTKAMNRTLWCHGS